MATRKELLASLEGLGGGLSKMQDRIQATKSWEQDQAEKKAQAEYLAKFRPLNLKTAEQGVQAGALGLEDKALELESSKKLVAAREALDQQISGEWGFVDPADAKNIPAWRSTLAVLNRSGQKTISPQEFYQAQKKSQSEETRAQESHASQLETEKARREQGNFTPYVLNGNALGAFNTRTGQVSNTGEQAQPKPGPVGNAKDVVKPGETLIPNMEPIPGVQITKDSVKKTKDAFSTYQSFKNQLTKYTDLVNKQGAELVGEKADEADALVTDLGLKLKELQELGVLTGNDWQLMMKQIPSSTSIGGNAKSAIYSMVGKDAFGPRLQVLNASVDDKFKNFAETNGFRKAAKQGGASGSFDAPSGSSKFKILSVE